MQIVLYFLIFAIGALIGSFCTLAVYRLPLGKDITHERSFCPKCNHRLNFLDLIPILSYIFLGGKCRYCNEKIRPRYIIIEIFSGITAVIFVLSFRLSIIHIELDKLISIFFGMLYITGLTIIAGIDKEKKQIQKSALIFNIVIVIAYIIYLFIVGNANMNRYAIYLFFVFALTALYFSDKKMSTHRKLPYGFYICVLNIISIIIENIILYYYLA